MPEQKGSSVCGNCLDFELAEATYPLCTYNFGYACYNPSTEQFKFIERFIMERLKVIDSEKSITNR